MLTSSKGTLFNCQLFGHDPCHWGCPSILAHLLTDERLSRPLPLQKPSCCFGRFPHVLDGDPLPKIMALAEIFCPHFLCPY